MRKAAVLLAGLLTFMLAGCGASDEVTRASAAAAEAYTRDTPITGM